MKFKMCRIIVIMLIKFYALYVQCLLHFILTYSVVRDRMFGVFERLCTYRKDPTHSLDEHIHLIYNKL